jgi:hypothetical protein
MQQGVHEGFAKQLFDASLEVIGGLQAELTSILLAMS